MILRRVYSDSLDRACGAMHLVVIEEKVVFYLLTYGFNIKRKYIKEKKEVLEVLIHFSESKGLKVRGIAKHENKFTPLQFR